MQAKLIGTGEAFDVRSGNNSCLLYGRRIPVILFDCGYQVPERLWQAPDLCNRIEAIWVTHLHADHASGLGPLLVRYWEDQRTLPLHVYGPAGLARYLPHLLDLAYPGMRGRLGFKVSVSEVRPGEQIQFRGLTLRGAFSRHSVPNLSVRADGPDGFSLGYSGDGALSPETEFLFRDVDLLLHEAYEVHPAVPVHMSLDALREYAREEGAGIGRIGVTHVSRFHKAQMAEEIRKLSALDSRWFLAEPGMELDVAALTEIPRPVGRVSLLKKAGTGQ